MSKFFVDTSAFFAVANTADTGHDEALAIMRSLSTSRADLFTTNFILAETHAQLLSKVGRVLASLFLHFLDTSTVRVVRVAERDERRAREIIAQYTDKEFSYTDATSFSVMERLHIRQAFSLDSDFEQFGFILIT